MSSGRLVALTGGTGFVGSHVTEALLEAGYRVRALVRRPESPGWLKGLPVEPVTGDVQRPDTLAALVNGADVVIHVAGRTSARSLAEYRAANAGGASNVVRAMQDRSPTAHLVLVSSQAAAGPSIEGRPVAASDPCRPVSSYGRSKREGEEAVERSGLPFTILRPSAVYGPRETAIRDLFLAASRGLVPVLAGGRPKVQMAYVADVAAAVLGALARGGRNETFFVAHPEVLDYRTIASTLAGLRSPPASLVPVPAPLIKAAGFVVGLLSALKPGPPVFNREKAAEMLQPAWLCCVEDAQEALGEPFRTPFAAGARLTWDWYRGAGIL